LLSLYYGNLKIKDIPRPYSDLILVDLEKNPYGLIQGVYDALDKERKRIRPLPLPPFPTPLRFAEEKEPRTLNLRGVLMFFQDEEEKKANQ